MIYPVTVDSAKLAGWPLNEQGWLNLTPGYGADTWTASLRLEHVPNGSMPTTQSQLDSTPDWVPGGAMVLRGSSGAMREWHWCSMYASQDGAGIEFGLRASRLSMNFADVLGVYGYGVPPYLESVRNGWPDVLNRFPDQVPPAPAVHESLLAHVNARVSIGNGGVMFTVDAPGALRVERRAGGPLVNHLRLPLLPLQVPEGYAEPVVLRQVTLDVRVRSGGAEVSGPGEIEEMAFRGGKLRDVRLTWFPADDDLLAFLAAQG